MYAVIITDFIACQTQKSTADANATWYVCPMRILEIIHYY